MIWGYPYFWKHPYDLVNWNVLEMLETCFCWAKLWKTWLIIQEGCSIFRGGVACPRLRLVKVVFGLWTHWFLPRLRKCTVKRIWQWEIVICYRYRPFTTLISWWWEDSKMQVTYSLLMEEPTVWFSKTERLPLTVFFPSCWFWRRNAGRWSGVCTTLGTRSGFTALESCPFQSVLLCSYRISPCLSLSFHYLKGNWSSRVDIRSR